MTYRHQVFLYNLERIKHIHFFYLDEFGIGSDIIEQNKYFSKINKPLFGQNNLCILEN